MAPWAEVKFVEEDKFEVNSDAKLKDKKDVFLRFIENCPIHNTIINTRKVAIILS